MIRSSSPPAPALVLLAALAAACGGGSQGPGGRPTPVEQGGATPAASQLTTAEAVMEASIAAQGGRERMGKLKAMRQTGSVRIVEMGMTGTVTTAAAPPRNVLARIDLAGIGKIDRGVSGDVAWEVSPMSGARVMSGPERDQTLRDATFNADLRWKELFPRAELAGVVEFAGQQAYKVVLTAADGDAQTRYFAKDTLLPVGSEKVARSQMGDIPGVEIQSDWREVDGIKYPHKVQIKQGPQTIEVTLDRIEHDPQLDPATFALPPEIAALQPKS